MEKLLTVTEAAIRLGITKELLFAYVRNAPKKHLGEDRKLKSVIKDGQNLFLESDLDEFDNYLREPWSKPGERRPPIPNYIQEYLKVEIGGKCPITDKGYPLDNAHITPYSESLNHHHHNLIRIAKDEHTKADNGVIPRQILDETKRNLVEILRNKLRLESSYNLSFTPPNPHPLFIGRTQKLLELISLMEVERVIVVQGLGGIGKTQLLLNALDNVRYHSPVVWIDVETVGSFDDFLFVLNNAVSSYVKNEGLTLFDGLREIRVTIILDSLEKLLISDRDKTEDFLQHLLLQTNQTQIIITSQIDLSIFDYPKEVIHLEGLDMAEGVMLIEEMVENQIIISNEHLSKLMGFCNGHPLAIKIVSSLIKFHKASESVIELLHKTENVKIPTRKEQNKSTALNNCLLTAYNCLSVEQEEIIQFIKFFPGGMKLKWAEAKFEQDSFSQNIAVLRQFFFIETKVDRLDFERLYIPNPIRPFLAEKALLKNDNEDRQMKKEAIMHIMMEAAVVDLYYIESGIHGDPSYGIARIEDEFINLLDAFTYSEKNATHYALIGDEQKEEYLNIVANIARALGKFCFTRGYFDYGIMFSNAGIKANLQLKNIEEVATQYMYLGQIQCRQFDYESFSITVKELINLAISTDNVYAKIFSKWAEASLEFYKGNYSQSLSLLKQTVKFILEVLELQSNEDYFEDIDNETIKEYAKYHMFGNLSLVIAEIAKSYEFSGSYKEAYHYYKKAIKIQEQFKDDTNLMSSYHHFAYCLVSLNQIEEGHEFYFKSIKGFRRNGQFEYLANSISRLGVNIEDYPELAKHKLLDKETLYLALNSHFNQLKEFILRTSENIGIQNAIEKIPYALLSKTMLLSKIMGFSRYCLLLTECIEDFAKEINVQTLQPSLFTAMLNVSHAIGGINEWKNVPETRPIMIKTILQCCIVINGGPDLESKTRIFYWLATWMQFTGLDNEAVAEKLWRQAWDSFDK